MFNETIEGSRLCPLLVSTDFAFSTVSPAKVKAALFKWKCSFSKNKGGVENSLILFRCRLLRAKQAHTRKRVMICFRSIFYTTIHFGRHTSAGHVWNNGCHNCPVQLINLPSPSNQSVSPLANTGYIPALNARPSFTVAQKGGSGMVMSLLQEAARSNSTKRLPQDVFKSMTARLSRENVTESWFVVKLL